jgi:excisionase family DNA binding protein
MANTIGGDGGAIPCLVDSEYVARYLGVTVRHVRRLVAEHRIPFIKWGHLLRFDLAEIAEWVNKWRHGC